MDHGGSLHPFQQEAVDWLVERGGGFLFDEPGLGKTRQAIVAAKRMGGSVLVVCPSSLKLWWQQEIFQMYPSDKVLVTEVAGRVRAYFTLLNGARINRELDTEETGEYFIKLAAAGKLPDWTIVHYTGARISRKAYRGIPWNVVILDESHFIKNRKAQRTQAIMALTPVLAHRIGLTATPFGNNPADLWAQLRWMAPQVRGLKSYWKFFETFVDYEYEHRPNGAHYRKIKGGKNLQILAQIMNAYGRQRMKKDVAPQLPPITDTYMPLHMTERQEHIYRAIKRKSTVELVFPGADEDIDSGPNGLGSGSGRRILITNALARLVRMEQWLSCPWIFKPGIDGSKIEWLKTWTTDYTKQAVIVCRFKASAKRVAEELGKTKCRHHITGDISLKSRNAIIEDWKSNKHQFLVGTIDTIGIGLSFEQAHVMVCFDQLPSTIKMQQVRQRVHRLTSKHPVQVIYLYNVGTSNEIILKSFLERWRQIQLVIAFMKHIREEKNDST